MPVNNSPELNMLLTTSCGTVCICQQNLPFTQVVSEVIIFFKIVIRSLSFLISSSISNCFTSLLQQVKFGVFVSKFA